MANTVPRGQEIGYRTWSEIIHVCIKPSGKHRNCNCVGRTVAGTFAFILSGLLILLTMLFLYVGQKVNCLSIMIDHEYILYMYV